MDIDNAPSVIKSIYHTGDQVVGVNHLTIRLHPMALIGISDHHTRISVGGTAWASHSFVTGLLFGYSSDTSITIVDAEEVDFPHRVNQNMDFSELSLDEVGKDIRTKVELHTQVFPTHQVLGFYKVVNTKNKEFDGYKDSDEILPNSHDLNIHNYGLIRIFCQQPLFLLMNSCSADITDALTSQNLSGNDQLPIAIYQSVTVGMEEVKFIQTDFLFEAFEPEKISIEKAFSNDSIQFGISSVTSRISIIIDYLRLVQSGEIQPDHSIIRDIDTLIGQISFISSSKVDTQKTDVDDKQLELYLGSIAKATSSIHSLSSKVFFSEKRAVISAKMDK